MNDQAIKYVIKNALGLSPPGRQISVRPDDTFVVSYPKSGSTWMRFLLANLLFRSKANFLIMERLIPDIYISSKKDLSARPSPRFLKSHEYFDPSYMRVIYIVRDPRDVACSYWHHQKKFGRIQSNTSFEAFVDSFLTGVDLFGTWSEHVGSWLGAREGDESFLLVKYEDLHQATRRVLEQVLEHVGLDFKQAEIERAISDSEFSRLQELEKNQGRTWKPLQNTHMDQQFMRSGKIGEWRIVQPQDAIQRIVERWGPLMERLGYLSLQQCQ